MTCTASPHAKPHPSTSRSGLAGWLALALVLQFGGSAAADTSPRFETVTTPRGLTFHYREMATTPFAAINFGMRDLWSLTTPGKEAFGALGPALVMQGADETGQSEFIERLKDLTASASLSFGAFSTQGNARAPTATIAQSMMLLSAALKGAQPSEKLLARLRQRSVGAEAQASLRAETIAERAALWFALGEHPFTRGLDPARYERVATGDLDQWRRAALDRSRLRIAASGRISREEAGRIIDEAFADLPTLGPLPDRSWPEIKPGHATIVVEHDTPQSAVVMLGLTRIGPGRDLETAQPAMSVLSGSNGRLWEGVRVRLGSTYGASASTMVVGPGKRLVVLRAAVANDQVKASAEALTAAYAKWRAEGISQAELASARSRIVTDFRASMDEPSRANSSVIAMQLANRPVEDLYGYEARIAALDRDTVNQFIRDRFPAPEALVTVIVTPRAQNSGASCVVKQPAEAARCPRS